MLFLDVGLAGLVLPTTPMGVASFLLHHPFATLAVAVVTLYAVRWSKLRILLIAAK
jgi:hypothetical protein